MEIPSFVIEKFIRVNNCKHSPSKIGNGILIEIVSSLVQHGGNQASIPNLQKLYKSTFLTFDLLGSGTSLL
jgi:hypothetical protein